MVCTKRVENMGEEMKKEEVNEENLLMEEKEQKSEKKKSLLWEVFSWVLTFALAIGLALALKSYVIINATVPTGSMEHTIEPGDDLFGLRLTYYFSEVKRGDIIIFQFPDDETQKYVKRVIGLPGETVTIDDGKIYIDDSETPLEEPYLKDKWVQGTGPFKFEVPEDGYFVMGDNRNDSFDARYWDNTYVTSDEIIGKAYFIYYPFSRFGSLYK